MPYKDQLKQQEYWRDKKREKRLSTPPDVHPVMSTRPNRLGKNGLPEMVANDYNPDELLSDGRLRYLGPLSDGQVLDRLTVNSACPDDVGAKRGQHPFYGMNSTVGLPVKMIQSLKVTRDVR